MGTEHVDIEWVDDKKDIVIITMHTGWTWSEIYEIQKQHVGLLESLPYKTDVIYNINKTQLPYDNVLSHLRALTTVKPANLKRIGVIKSLTFGDRMLSVFLKVNPYWRERFVIRETLEEILAVFRAESRQIAV